MCKIVLSAALILAGIGYSLAGQTGAFEEFKNRAWACSSEDAIADVMAGKSASIMKATASRRGGCHLIKAGTPVWVHGGNALIEFGSVEGQETLMYYPAAAVASE